MATMLVISEAMMPKSWIISEGFNEQKNVFIDSLLKKIDFDKFNISSIEEELIICNKYKPYHITYRRGGVIETF